MTSEISKWADSAMYSAEPMAAEGEEIHPKVTLISMTDNPLRVMAAAAELYRGRVVFSPHQVSRSTAEKWLEEIKKTKLQAPLEYIDLHFLIEGVTRAFTHQLVRQRTAVYVQESLRFSVKENAALEVTMPPSIAELKDDHPCRVTWNSAVADMGKAYNRLVNAGIPAEDARGLLPTNITTRIHYKTNLRNLVEHSGYRLCSQAQHEWKLVWNEMLYAIASYGSIHSRWQQLAINTLFKPICYMTGKCEFMSATDRYCVIRDRVQAHYVKGESPDSWADINPMEPLQHTAARKASHG